ncbi:macrophage colony-stimulating factor 1 receptor 2 isoform X2 [Parambassis ranga]|uniref:receptor protein-tyrosine kinase n=1 Tax=Parambassis ranga TaxID=210632 RepID=A0A6P7JN39_9TELE|nr:macrophage colony-stimulating factor 1 receptor 2-like isoform X2 [Parambassis ranga]
MWFHSVLLSIALSCFCSAGEPIGPPLIQLNSTFLPNRSSKVLTAGFPFRLSCHGNGSVYWSSTAFRLLYQDKLQNPVEVRKSEPRHTGTYHCGYTNRSLDHLDARIHLYVKDLDNPASMFVTPRSSIPTLTEGQDFLFRCLLTDPSVTDLTFQSESKQGVLPPGMNVTFDPQKGVLIRDLKMSFRGSYVCSGWKDGKQFKSKPFDLLVLPKHLPPSLSLSQNEAVRLEGELFEVTCLSDNPSHFLSLTWTHPKIQLNITETRHYRNNHLYINSTMTVSAVTQTHSGPYTCTAINDAEAATATVQLKVLDRPYLRIYLQVIPHANANTWASTVHRNANISSMPTEIQEEIKANISSTSLEVNEELIANVSSTNTNVNGASNANISGSSRVEVHEGQDVTLTFVMEAYPPIRGQHWMTPTHINNDITACQESYTANGYRMEGSLLLRQVRQKDRGQYSFHFSNSFFNGSQSVDLRIYRPPTAVITLEGNTLTCSSSGYPLPTVLWFTCPGIQHTCINSSVAHLSSANVTSQEEEEEVRIHHPVSLGDDVSIECIAYNLVGDARDMLRSRSAGAHTVFTPTLIGALSAAAILLLLLLVVFYKYRQKPKYEIRWKIIESTNGNNYTFVDPTLLPYNQKWEFPRDKLRLGAVVGSGAFGKVVEATAYGLGTDNEVTRVAVKMLKPSAHSEEREALMSELKILSHLGYHDNIVNLLGACTRGGPMLMITEYCSHGDLLNFLRAHAQDLMASMFSLDQVEEEAFYKNLATRHIRLRSDSGISCCSDYQEMLPVLSPEQTQGGVKTGSLSVSDLMRFSYQVAQGLDFLSTRNCIHRDVAARNVLLTDRHVAKICDFGLARDIRNDDSYIVQGNARLPVKWMAPESIFQCIYTVQSDVWSYGVLLWEIFSLGKSPYPNIAVDTNFYKMIKDGRHMEQPDFAPAEMYQLMTLCWSLEPTDRPTFHMICQLINSLLPSTNDTTTNHSTQPTYRNINECREEDEDEEKEETRGGLKTEQEQDRPSDDGEEEESRNKNIYQLS